MRPGTTLRVYADLLPKARGPEGEETVGVLRSLILNSLRLLEDHPVNRARVARGEVAANMIWPWSPGRKPAMRGFSDMYGMSGAIVSAVDVINCHHTSTYLGKLSRMQAEYSYLWDICSHHFP